MLAELIMHVMDWGDVWYAHPGPIRVFGLRVLRGCRWHVGTWTGADHDLICVKECPRRDGMTNDEVNAEADKWTSPGANSIWVAALKSLFKRWRLGRKLTKCQSCRVLPGEVHSLDCTVYPIGSAPERKPGGGSQRGVWTGNIGDPSVGLLPPSIIRPGGKEC